MEYDVNTGSGKEMTLPSPPPLRTGRESFPSSGSSQCKALRKQNRSRWNFPRDLDDTHLQPSNLSVALGSAKLCPSDRRVGRCTRGLLCVHLRYPPSKVLPVLSSRLTNWKSARLHGEVMLQPLSAPLQDGLGFLQYPLPRTPTALLTESPASRKRPPESWLGV